MYSNQTFFIYFLLLYWILSPLDLQGQSRHHKKGHHHRRESPSYHHDHHDPSYQRDTYRDSDHRYRNQGRRRIESYRNDCRRDDRYRKHRHRGSWGRRALFDIIIRI